MPIEQRGVDTIPEHERTSGPRDLVSILLGSNLCLGVIVFGWLPPSFGLGWWASVSAIVAGTVAGILFTAPLALVSLRTATNLSTSSGAQFGVRGRLVGSVVGLLLALGYTALTVWIGGDVMLRVLGRLFGVPADGVSYALVYAVLAAATVAGAVYGYRVLLAMSRVLAVGMTALLLLGVLAYAPHFTTAALPDAGGYLLGSFWPTWFLAVVAAGLSGPIAFITLLGDYTRYISPARHRARRVLHATWLGLFLGLLVPPAVRHLHGVRGARGHRLRGPAGRGLPGWYLVPLLLAASAGSVGNAGLMLYSMGLDLDAILPRASRARATYTVAVVATACVFAGHYAWDAQSAMTSFVLLLTAIGTPWAVITLIGFARCRGVYDADALQVFNRRSRGGVYWYRAGWNVGATVSWALGAAVGLLAVSLPSYEGPLLAWTGGVDCSFLLSGGGGRCAVRAAGGASRRGAGNRALRPDAAAVARRPFTAVRTALLTDAVHPAVLVLGHPALDAQQGLPQPQGDRPRRAVAVGPGVRLGLDVADGRDHRGGAAGEDLGQRTGRGVLAPLLEGDGALLGGVAEVPGDLEEGVAGDALQDGAGERRGDDPVAVDEGDVHAAALLDLGAGDRVEVDDLVAAVCGGLGLRQQGRGVVAAGLGVAGAARDRADVVLGDPDGDRLHPRRRSTRRTGRRSA